MTLTSIHNFFAKLLGSFFYTAFLPLAPATWASMVALPVAWFLWRLPLLWALPFFAISLVLAVWSAGAYDRLLGSHDNRLVVIDEAMGVLLVTMGLEHTYVNYFLALVLFRIFDNWKPFPANWIDEKVSGGLGVVVDDLVAAIYALLLLVLFSFFRTHFL